VNTEAEESVALRAVTKQRLTKADDSKKFLPAVLHRKECELAMAV
jgi:hypothetical protein